MPTLNEPFVVSQPVYDFLRSGNLPQMVSFLQQLATNGQNLVDRVVQGNDARLSNARTPLAHGSTHEAAGSDAIKLDDLKAPDDNADLDASTVKHGLMSKSDKIKLDGMDLSDVLFGAQNLADVANADVSLANLGGTEPGIELFKLPDTGAVKYLRINADGTVSQLTAAALASALGISSTGIAKLWVTFDGTQADNQAATYSRTGTTVTVTLNAHGHIAGHRVYAHFTSGGAADGTYLITSATANTFTFETALSGTIAAGSAVNLLRRLIRESYNVHSITYLAAGAYFVNFSAGFGSSFFCPLGSANNTGVAKHCFVSSSSSFLCSLSVLNISTLANEDVDTCALAIFATL